MEVIKFDDKKKVQARSKPMISKKQMTMVEMQNELSKLRTGVAMARLESRMIKTVVNQLILEAKEINDRLLSLSEMFTEGERDA